MSGKPFLNTAEFLSRTTTPDNADSSSLLRVSPGMIEPDPFQPRRVFDEQKLQELAESLKRHGQLQPIRVRRSTIAGRYVIVAGERRWRAARLAGLDKLDAVLVSERADADYVKEAQVVENLQRADLSPIESAEAYRALLSRWECSQAELARRLGVATSTVSRALALLEAPADVRSRVEAGESVRQATGTAKGGRRRRAPSKPDKRRAVELELGSGFVRLKRGATIEQLVEELRALAVEQRSQAEAA